MKLNMNCVENKILKYSTINNDDKIYNNNKSIQL